MSGELLELKLKLKVRPVGPRATAIGIMLSGGTICPHEKKCNWFGGNHGNSLSLVSSIGRSVPPTNTTACASSTI